MKVKLLRAARIRHEAGETVKVSPAEAGFLISTGSAVRIPETEGMARGRETPEDTAQRSTRKKK